MNDGQVAGDANAVNGFAHRFKASGTNLTLQEADLIDMSLAFNKANAPMGGRVAVVDPVTAAAFAKRAQLVNNMDASDSLLVDILKSGWMRDHTFVTDLHGWKIFTSNRLPTITGETMTEFDGTNSGSTTGVANIFMCVGDDQVKPGMLAWRQPPKVENGRDRSKKRDEFDTTARWGVGVQRLDTLGVIVTSATATE